MYTSSTNITLLTSVQLGMSIPLANFICHTHSVGEQEKLSDIHCSTVHRWSRCSNTTACEFCNVFTHNCAAHFSNGHGPNSSFPRFEVFSCQQSITFQNRYANSSLNRKSSEDHQICGGSSWTRFSMQYCCSG